MPPKTSVGVQVRWHADSGREAQWRQLARLLLAKAMPSHGHGRAAQENRETSPKRSRSIRSHLIAESGHHGHLPKDEAAHPGATVAGVADALARRFGVNEAMVLQQVHFGAQGPRRISRQAMAGSSTVTRSGCSNSLSQLGDSKTNVPAVRASGSARQCAIQEGGMGSTQMVSRGL